MRRILLVLFLIALIARYASPYQEIDVVNGGIIQGKVIWKTGAPPAQTIPVMKDKAICGDSKVISGSPNSKINGVSYAVVYLEGIAQGKKNAVTQKLQLDQKQCEYSPHVLLVPSGSDVEILNSDATLHNVHTYNLGKPSAVIAGRPATFFNLAFPVKGHKVTRKFSETGKFLSLCDAGHPWMSATIVVTEHPYYVLTDSQGNYRLENVPAGTYKIHVWHQNVPKLENNTNNGFLAAKPLEQTKDVTVPANGSSSVNFEL